MAGVLGAIAFVYQLPPSILNPTNVRWMMVGDRGAALSGWLFERQAPWTLPFGILHNMMPPLVTTVGYSDALPWLAAPAKLLFGWMALPWQYSGVFLLTCYVLQAIFGFLVLRALSVSRPLAIVGSAFFATSPALLQRFHHISLCAHWEVLAAWWLYLRPQPARSGWRLLLPWLVLLAVTIPTYVYLGLMVGALAAATYARALWIDRSIRWPTAILHALVTGVVIYGVFWVFGYFVLHTKGETGFGLFSADILAFFNSAGYSKFIPPIPGAPRDYERYYFLGLGVLILLPISLGLALRHRASTRWTVASSRDDDPGTERPENKSRAPDRHVTLWPGLLVALLMFAYAWATPVMLAGHPILTLPFYAHFPNFTMWFRGSGRFAWPLYYLVMALVLATVSRRFDPRLAGALLLVTLGAQIVDQRPLRATVQREYNWPWPQLTSPAWHGIGHSFRSLRMVPPILAHRVACWQYDQHEDYEIKFGVLAATERMNFNSGNVARIDNWQPLCRPMLDSLQQGLLDDRTVYVPSAPYREAMLWWARGHVVCGTLDEANVCVARDSVTDSAPLTRLLIARDSADSATVLHFDVGGGDPPILTATHGFTRPDSGGRRLVDSAAEVEYLRPFPRVVDLVVDAVVTDTARRARLTLSLGGQSRSVTIGPHDVPDTVHFNAVNATAARVLRLAVASPPATGGAAGAVRPPSTPSSPPPSRPPVRIKQLTIRVP